MHLLSLMGIKISSILLVITLDDINVLLRDAFSSMWDGIEFIVQIFKPAFDLLLSHHELLLPAVILIYFAIRSSRMIFFTPVPGYGKFISVVWTIRALKRAKNFQPSASWLFF